MRVRGLRETLAKLHDFGEQGKTRIKQITAVNGQEIATKAISNLEAYHDVDQDGEIRKSINAESKDNGFRAIISVNRLPMGAYIEFGTGTYVEVDPEWKDIAWQFYVNGQGHLHPHPFFWPAFNQGREKYMEDIKAAFEELTRQFNSRR